MPLASSHIQPTTNLAKTTLLQCTHLFIFKQFFSSLSVLTVVVNKVKISNLIRDFHFPAQKYRKMTGINSIIKSN